MQGVTDEAYIAVDAHDPALQCSSNTKKAIRQSKQTVLIQTHRLSEHTGGGTVGLLEPDKKSTLQRPISRVPLT